MPSLEDNAKIQLRVDSFCRVRAVRNALSITYSVPDAFTSEDGPLGSYVLKQAACLQLEKFDLMSFSTIS